MTNDRADAAPVKRIPRNSVMLSALVEQPGRAEPGRHRVRDLSSGGVRIDTRHSMRVGENVRVTIGALARVRAKVAWVKEGWAGLKFVFPVNPDEARAAAAIPPGSGPMDTRASTGTTPNAGWLSDLSDPYVR